MRLVIAWAGLACAAACLRDGRFLPGQMVGFLPPHYGYSAYVESAAIFAAPWPAAQLFLAAVLLLSTNRCAWVGVIAGWGFLGGWRRRCAAAALIFVAVVGGARLKPMPYNDIVRREIWAQALARPAVGAKAFGQTRVLGMRVELAHSDLLELYVIGGPALALLALFLGLWALRWVAWPKTDAAAVVVCLAVQSVVDSRLHYPACQVCFLACWLWAIRERRETLEPLLARPDGRLPWL